jgi:hypothetical protein
MRVLVALLFLVAFGLAQQTKFSNCSQLNKVYPAGIGRAGAVDKVRAGQPRVTNFRVNTQLYNQIISRNGNLDRDKDGIACERR